MSKDDETGTGSGLLSKVVKFVTRPTTHWSDLEQPEESSSESESRLALKEMVERKRQYEFVRNREFDMLRKLRRKQRPGETPGAGASQPFVPSSQSLDTEDRERTLKKIDEIEAQMASSWFRRGPGLSARHAARQAQGALAADMADTQPPPQQAQAVHPLAYQPTHQPAPQGAVDLDEDAASRAFAPTVLLPQADADAPAAFPTAPASPAAPARQPPPAPAMPPAASAPAAPAFAPEPAAAPPQPPAAPAPAPRPALVSFGGLEDFNVEVIVKARQAPEIEEAAILFANGDTAGAEVGLRALLADGHPLQAEQDTWLTLFDLYRASGEQDKFDDMAAAFAARFGRSAPQWALVSQTVIAPLPDSAPAAPQHSSQFNWSCPPTMTTQTVATMKASLARAGAMWSANWRSLKTIDPAALPGLTEALLSWGSQPTRFKFLGEGHLLELLAAHSPTDDRDADPQWWTARLALLRVLGEMDEFDLVALNYCVTYEVSPPAWEAPACTYVPASDDGTTLLPSSFGAEDGSAAAPATQPTAAPPAEEDSGTLKAELKGELLGSADSAVGAWQASVHTQGFEINCRQLRRADFGAAGDLLNWALGQREQGRFVTFKQVNRIVAAFFGVVGLNDAVRIMLRTD